MPDASDGGPDGGPDGGRDSGSTELDARAPTDAASVGDSAPLDSEVEPGLLCYCDRDGDGVFSAFSEPILGGSCAAAGCQPTPGLDCCDSDRLAGPGASFHDYQSACGSWDWDCSGDVALDPGCYDCSGVGSSGLSVVCPGSPTTCLASGCRDTTCGEAGRVVVAVANTATCTPTPTVYPRDAVMDPNGWSTCGLQIGACVGDGCTTPGSCRCR